ncbi:hypothetical protein NGI08_23405 [Klebsiella michiganensis]|uniref:hypothetical protein n=1 Tax=Klebsiella/Raoultella group TaxID=2890311 RepID=UPI001CCF1B15|nr:MULTISPECIES: hypothetical protein [Klebsiella/Raoultella group]MEB8081728.1 hypothetical protein [Klebsiella michiganensis]
MSDAEACTQKKDNIELAQSHELLIANGNETANLLRHLANNEIDSDYFAVVSECESYGQETEGELAITDFALRAAGFVDELVEALVESQQRIVELESKLSTPVLLPKTNGYWTKEEKAYEEAITLAKRQIRLAGFLCEGNG